MAFPRSERDLDICTGDLRSRATITRPVTADDGAGGTTITGTTTVAAVWARVRQLSAREAVTYGGVRLDTMREVILRYRSDVVATDAVVIDGTEHNIRSIENVRGAWLVLHCQSGVLTP